MSTVVQFARQWRNPSDVSAILMIIGGDVVRTALAQSTGTMFTPVCFSFGWVAYAFMALINVLGDGRLMPPPDVAVKVFNMNSGYARDCKNWVIGRIARDHEYYVRKRYPCDKGIRITIYEAEKNPNGYTNFSYDRLHLYSLGCIAVQFVVASIPIMLDRDWSVLFITIVGTSLAQGFGALPQWVAEKLPNRQDSKALFAITPGNGSKDVMIIKGMGNCLNLEELSVPDTPRNDRPWEKFCRLLDSTARSSSDLEKFKPRHNGRPRCLDYEVWGRPLGFIITLITTTLQCFAWLALMITVGAVQNNTWFLLAVGVVGMLQNGTIAAVERPPEARNLPLKHRATIVKHKVMDALMDVNDWLKDPQYGNEPGADVKCLAGEFFPGGLRGDEEDWWRGHRRPYDEKREMECNLRGFPFKKTLEMRQTELAKDKVTGLSE